MDSLITFFQVVSKPMAKSINPTNIIFSRKNSKEPKKKTMYEQPQLRTKHSIEEIKELFLFDQIGHKSKKEL